MRHTRWWLADSRTATANAYQTAATSCPAQPTDRPAHPATAIVQTALHSRKTSRKGGVHHQVS